MNKPWPFWPTRVDPDRPSMFYTPPSRFSPTGKRRHRRVNPTPAQGISLPGSLAPKGRGVL